MRTMRQTLASQTGTTLVELLIASFLTVLVAAAALEFYLSSHKAWLVENEVAEIQQNARACLDEIGACLRLGGYQLKNHPAYKIRPDSLVVYYRNDATATVDTVAYFVDDQNPKHPLLRRQLPGESSEILAENIEALTITAVSSRVLQVVLTCRADTPDSSLIDGDGYRRRTFSTQIRLRNS